MKRVVCIDDDPSFLLFINRALVQAGFELTAYNKSTDFLQHSQDKQLNADLIICDLMMPSLSGYELIWLIKTKREYKYLSNVPIIALTALENDLVKAKLIEIEADGWIRKPIRAERLIEVISNFFVSGTTE